MGFKDCLQDSSSFPVDWLGFDQKFGPREEAKREGGGLNVVSYMCATVALFHPDIYVRHGSAVSA